jgi:cell division septum initiation protein DivIVA
MENVTVSNQPGDKLFDDDPFDVTFLGFSRGQVEEFIAETRTRVRALEAQLAEVSRAYEQARTQLTQATSRLDDATHQLAARAPHEEVGGRLMEILRLANEEADQTRGNALSEVERMVQDAHGRAQSVLESAQLQAEDLLSKARQESEVLLTGAERESGELLERSRRESDDLLVRSR